jgi:osmotically-inducible protein OsmY
MRRYLNLILALALASGIAIAQTQQTPASEQGKTSMANPADIQNDIQSALQKEPTLTGANINVQVTDKYVELSGTVPSKEAKDMAEQIAKSHAAGLDVKSHLKLSSAAGPGKNR